MPQHAIEDWTAKMNLSQQVKLSIIQASKTAVKAAGVTEDDRLGLSHPYIGASLYQLACPCQIVCAAYESSQRLHRIVRPFLSPKTWNEAIEVARRGGCALPTETVEASILWLDIANFTELTNCHSLDQILIALNAYFDALTQIVYRYRGDVNKYLGDGFLGVFSNADDAVQAGCALQGAAADFNRRQLAQDGLVFPTRIGIDTGQIVIANLGSHERQDRAVIGMPVILAERLQEQAPPGRVWLSHATFERLQDRSDCRTVGQVKVKGRLEPVIVYEK
jgi:class 3 adenylate cyclase